MYGGKDDEGEGDDLEQGLGDKFTKSKAKSYASKDDDDYDLNTSRKIDPTATGKDKKFQNKKRGRVNPAKKGKLNMEYEYEDKHKETQQEANYDW